MFLSHSFRFLSQNVRIFLFCENFAYFRDANWSEISRKKSENFAFFTSERNVKNAKFSARNATFSRNDFHFSMETLVRMRSFSQRKHSRVSILNTFAKRRKEALILLLLRFIFARKICTLRHHSQIWGKNAH